MKTYFLLPVLCCISISIFAQTVNVPDLVFWNYLLNEGFDLNGDGLIQESEAIQVEVINLNGTELQELTGINGFTNLQELWCEQTDIESAELISLPKLEIFSARNSWAMTSVDLSGVPNLRYLNIQFTSDLAEVDLSLVPLWDSLDLSGNEISAIDCTSLTELKIHWLNQ